MNNPEDLDHIVYTGFSNTNEDRCIGCLTCICLSSILYLIIYTTLGGNFTSIINVTLH